MNIFASQFLNSLFGTGNPGVLSSLASDGILSSETSPFAALLQNGENSENGKKPSTLSILNTNTASVPVTEEARNDLSSPELIMSDLLAVNWQALQNGEQIKLPCGFTLSMSDSGMLSLSDESGNLVLPEFSKEQLQAMLDAYEQVRDLVMDEALAGNKNKEGRKEEEPAKENRTERVNAKTDNAEKTNTEKKTVDITFSAQVNNKAAFPAAAIASSSTAAIPTEVVTTLKSIIEPVVDNPLRPLLLASFYDGAHLTGGSTSPNNLSITMRSILGVSSPRSNVSNILAPAPITGEKLVTSIINPDRETEFHLTHDFMTGLPVTGAEDEINTSLNLQTLLQDNGIKITANGNLTGTHPINTSQLTMVLQKMAEKNDTRVLTVQIDPPELGRVQVQLTSNNEKSMSARILVEKPEAITALKRDLAQLEKALHNAGIQLDGDSISFDLASDNGGQSAFDQQEFRELWENNKNHTGNKTGIEIANDDLKADALSEAEDFYQSDTAVNIKV